MDDRERNDNCPCPCRHLVDKAERKKHHFRWNRGTSSSREQAKEAEIGSHIAVRRLKAAHLKDARAKPGHSRVVRWNPSNFQPEIGLNRGADFRGTMEVNTEAPVIELPGEYRLH